MSAPQRGGRAGGDGRDQRPSAAPRVLPADANSVGSASSCAGGSAAWLAAAAPTPGAAVQPPASSPPAATPGSADAPRAGLAALSLHPPGSGDSATTRGGALVTRLAPLPTSASQTAGDAASFSLGAGASAVADDAVARGGGVPGPAAAASTGDASVPDDRPPVFVGDDGLPLSAEAAASPFSPPASERHAAFLKLVDSTIKAGLQKRHLRCADFSALAAEAGVPLFGDDSLVVANLRAGQASALGNQSAEEPDPAEAEALQRRAWVVLLAQALPVLQSRLDKGTVVPGKLRKVEEAFKVYEQQTAYRVTEQPVPGADALFGISRLMGYDTALLAAHTALGLLPLHLWRGEQRGRAQALVLATLRLIPKTAGLPDQVAYELELVNVIEHYMTPSVYGADFCASVLAVWRSRAVADVLRFRGSLQSATAAVAADDVEHVARKQADVAKRGLWRCALPSCGKQEATALQFRVCGHCQSTRYCCPEHAKQHWKAHKREYEAEGEEGGEASGGGGAAA